jgi:hypothetical protein
MAYNSLTTLYLAQEPLARMLGNVTATQAMMPRLAQLQDEGVMQDEHESLAKGILQRQMPLDGRAVRGRPRSDLFLRGHQEDEHPDRRQVDHGIERLRLKVR